MTALFKESELCLSYAEKASSLNPQLRSSDATQHPELLGSKSVKIMFLSPSILRKCLRASQSSIVQASDTQTDTVKAENQWPDAVGIHSLGLMMADKPSPEVASADST